MGVLVRNRGSVILIENDEVVLIKRVRDGITYYVFPGGGIEEGESPEAAAKREALEELGVKVKLNECIAKVQFNGDQYYFLGDILEGTIGTGAGEEFSGERKDRGTYELLWVKIDYLKNLDVRPKLVVEKIYNLKCKGV